jgi:CRP-like cAMP-binding protein
MADPLDLVQSAFFWGIISAVSLPLGAWIGLVVKPGKKIRSALMAFGAGALLFALTIELFAKALEHIHEYGKGVIYVSIVAAVAGGLLFDLLNQLLNNRGAFLRKLGTTRRHIAGLKALVARRVIQELSQVSLLQSLPPRDIVKLIPHMKRTLFEPDEIIFRQGEIGSALYFIVWGEVEILHEEVEGPGRVVAVLEDNDTFGEMALLRHTKRNATAKARTRTYVLKVHHSDFDVLLTESEALRLAVRELFDRRADDLAKRTPGSNADLWKEECLDHLEHLQMPVTDLEIDSETQSAARAKGAAVAIWLGILLDGIPESLIIGMLTVSVTGVSIAFIAGVFLANLPEAVSSSVVMHRSGMRFRKVLWMWTSLCIMTGVGAVIGVLIFPANPAGAALYWIAGIEGLAAGAMLTMIAETMLPEAFEQGGAIVGMATLLGFLTTLVVKIL